MFPKNFIREQLYEWCHPSLCIIHMRTYIVTILTMLVLLCYSALNGLAVTDFTSDAIKPAPFDIPEHLGNGEYSILPEQGVVINRLPIERLSEIKLIIARLAKFDGQVEGLPIVNQIHDEGDSLIIVFGYTEGVYPIDVLTGEAIEVIKGVLEALRRVQISIEVHSKKDLIDCFGIDGFGKVRMVNLNRLRFLIIRKAIDRSIDHALSFIDDGKRH
jgi:hypothetical protein